MSRLARGTRGAVGLVVLGLAWPWGATLRADDAAVATAAWTGNEVIFSGAGDHELLLKVTGPEFASVTRGRGSVAFRAQDKAGQPLPDGIYRYELTEIAASEIEQFSVVRDPAQAEPNPGAERRQRPASIRQHNLFRIEGTALVPPVERPHGEPVHASQPATGVDSEPEHEHPHPQAPRPGS